MLQLKQVQESRDQIFQENGVCNHWHILITWLQICFNKGFSAATLTSMLSEAL